MEFNSVDQSKRYYGYRHVWDVPRGSSIIDATLERVLLLVAFSLPLEGLLQEFTGSAGRSLAFYLGALALGLALLRMPHVLQNTRKSRGFVFLVIAYLWSFALYYASPMLDNTTNWLLVQLMMLAGTFLYIADREDLRRKLIWAYWLGWVLLVLWSLSSYSRGSYELYERGTVIRVVEISGYSANTHARQIASGIMVTLALMLSTRRAAVRFAAIGILFAAGFALLITNSRGGIFSLLLAVGLFILAQPLYFGASRRFTVLSVMSVILMIGFYYVFFETPDGQRFWNSYLVRVNEFLNAEEATSRERIYEATIDIFLENPFGVGQQNSLALLKEKLGVAFDPHSYYLRILAEGGLPGVILFGTGLYMVVRNGWRWQVNSGEDVFFWPLIYFLIAAATGRDFHFKALWFFLAMNALTPFVVDIKQRVSTVHSANVFPR